LAVLDMRLNPSKKINLTFQSHKKPPACRSDHFKEAGKQIDLEP
jgi:hypothetical protein